MRPTTAFSLIIVSFLLLSLFGIVSADSVRSVRVHVTNATGTPIQGATVSMTPEGSADSPFVTTTDANGNSLSHIYAIDTYIVVTVSADDYGTKMQTFRVWTIFTFEVSLDKTCPNGNCDEDAGETAINCPEDCSFPITPSFVLDEKLESSACAHPYVEMGSFVDQIGITRYLCVNKIETFAPGEYVINSYFEFFDGVQNCREGKPEDKDVRFSTDGSPVNHCVEKGTITQEEYDNLDKQIVLDSAVLDYPCPPAFNSQSEPIPLSSGKTIYHCARMLFKQTEISDCVISNPRWVDSLGAGLQQTGNVVGPVVGASEEQQGDLVYLVVDATLGCKSKTIVFYFRKRL